MSYLQEQSHIFGIYYNHWGSVWGSKQVWFGMEGGDQHFVLEQCFHVKKTILCKIRHFILTIIAQNGHSAVGWDNILYI